LRSVSITDCLGPTISEAGHVPMNWEAVGST
jgi:hypothetical protein